MTRALLLCLLFACSGPVMGVDLPDSGGGFDAGPLDAGVDAGLDGGHDGGASADAGGCGDNAVPLATLSFGDTDRYFVETTLDGRPVALQLDTGSSLSFVFQGPSAPPFTPVAARVQLGCEEVALAGRNLTAQALQVDGREVVGLLGMDFLLQRPSLLDVEGRRVTRLSPASAEAQRARATWAFGFDDVLGHALVPLSLDGTPVRLMFDTGGGHTLWVGVDGGPGDRVELVVDAEGTQFPVFVGTGQLRLGDAGVRTIPVARAPRFPYFEQTVAALGGNLHGLLGVTAFPGETLLVWDGQFYVAPR